MSKVIYLTEEGKAKLESELDLLKGPQREAIASRLKNAIEMGDLSENADYKAAKEDQGFLEGRIQEIELILNKAVMVDKGQLKTGEANIGSKVTVQEGDQKPEVFTLVGSKESDPRQNKISYESPIGKALIGHKKGDKVDVILPGKNVISLKILEIK
ncbi:MAG: transcription elongation factor GreA [Anaerolineaceae bacterium]|nr:transcription elongation factor GreA [Anaerolineaceae bacterium]